MSVIIHVYKNESLSEFDSYTYDDLLKAIYAIGCRDDLAADYPDVEKISIMKEPTAGEVLVDSEFHGWKVYDDSGICVLSHNGEDLGSVLPA